jgi:hypothetical protein
MYAPARLGTLWNSIQAWLFPMLEDELGELDDKHREFVAVCETRAPQAHNDACRLVGNGCPVLFALIKQLPSNWSQNPSQDSKKSRENSKPLRVFRFLLSQDLSCKHVTQRCTSS